MKHLSQFFLILTLLASVALSQVQITNTSVYYTAEQMLLANEINESGEPYAEALGYNLDDLDPMVANQPDSIAYTLGIDNYEYSRYQLGTIISRSGMGLHMMWAPIVRKMAAMEGDDFDGKFTMAPNGFKEDDELMKTIMHFSMLSNHTPPGNPWPQFAEFISGDPHLPQAVDADHFAWEDFSTLRWDRTKMDKTLNPAAMGQALMKQYLWAQDMLSAFHDGQDNGIDADGTVSPDYADNPHFDPNNDVYFGGDALDGFIGQVLTAEAINKVAFLLNALAFDGSSLGAVNPMTYNPFEGVKYFPHKIAVSEGAVAPMLPPRLNGMSVTDAGSDLFDQFSILWGTLNFKNMMDPDNSSDAAHLAYKEVFDGDPFPPAMSVSGTPGPYDLMKGASKVILQNVLYMHYNRRGRTFVDRVEVDNGTVEQGRHISTINAAYTIVGLEKFIEEFAGSDLADLARKAVFSQANFILRKLRDRNGTYFNGYTLGHGVDRSEKSVASQAGAVRGLYAAYQVTGRRIYLRAANQAYQILKRKYYVASAQGFRTTLGEKVATYTPFNFAVLAGALREANLVGGQPDAPAIYVRFFTRVGNSMQLSEAQATGETGGDSDGDGIPYIPEQKDQLPPVFATSANYDLGESQSSDVRVPFAGRAFAGLRNFPNPFNPSTQISFKINKAGNYKLRIYDVLGQEVHVLLNKYLEKGDYQVKFNASHLSGGIYFYQLKGSGITQVRKLFLLK